MQKAERACNVQLLKLFRFSMPCIWMFIKSTAENVNHTIRKENLQNQFVTGAIISIWMTSMSTMFSFPNRVKCKVTCIKKVSWVNSKGGAISILTWSTNSHIIYMFHCYLILVTETIHRFGFVIQLLVGVSKLWKCSRYNSNGRTWNEEFKIYSRGWNICVYELVRSFPNSTSTLRINSTISFETSCAPRGIYFMMEMHSKELHNHAWTFVPMFLKPWNSGHFSCKLCTLSIMFSLCIQGWPFPSPQGHYALRAAVTHTWLAYNDMRIGRYSTQRFQHVSQNFLAFLLHCIDNKLQLCISKYPWLL